MSDQSIYERIIDQTPVEFSIGEMTFSFRHPTPFEIDLLTEGQTLASDRVFAEYRKAGLEHEPVSIETQVALMMRRASLTLSAEKAKEEGDEARRIELLQELEDFDSIYPVTLIDERCRQAARRYYGRWVVQNLLVGDRAEFDRLTRPNALRHDAVEKALTELYEIVNYDPNSNGRQQ